MSKKFPLRTIEESFQWMQEHNNAIYSEWERQCQEIASLTRRIDVYESQLRVAMELVRDYYWLECSPDDCLITEKAKRMFSVWFQEALTDREASFLIYPLDDEYENAPS